MLPPATWGACVRHADFSPCLPRETFEDSKWCCQGSEEPLGDRFHLVLVFYLHHVYEYARYKINVNAKMLKFLLP